METLCPALEKGGMRCAVPPYACYGKALRERVQIRIDAGLRIIGHDRGAPSCWSSEDYVGGTPVERPRHGSTDETGTVLDQTRSNSWMVTTCRSVFDRLGHCRASRRQKRKRCGAAGLQDQHAQMRRGNDGRSDFTGAADFAQGGHRDARDPRRRRDRAQIVSRLHWLSIAIMTLRAAACRLVISGR